MSMKKKCLEKVVKEEMNLKRGLAIDPIPAREYKEFYKDGIKYALREVLASIGMELDSEVFDRDIDGIVNGTKTIGDFLLRFGFGKKKAFQRIDSESITAYPLVLDALSEFLKNNIAPAQGDAIDRIILSFFETFNGLSAMFEREITMHLSANRGNNVGALIILTYLTIRAFRRAGIIDRRLTMVETCAFFSKNKAITRRLFGKLRVSKKAVIECIENPAGAPDLETLMIDLRKKSNI